MSKYMTINELMDTLKVSRSTINNWREEGMPFEKFGKLVRFDEELVLTWLRNKGKESDEEK